MGGRRGVRERGGEGREEKGTLSYTTEEGEEKRNQVAQGERGGR